MRRLALLLLALGLAAASEAHDPATLDRLPSPHGGRIRMGGRYHVELVLEAKRIRAYFMNHANRPVEPPTGEVTVRLTQAGNSKIVVLEPTSDGSLGADGDFAGADDSVVEIVIARDEAEPLVVRFDR